MAEKSEANHWSWKSDIDGTRQKQIDEVKGKTTVHSDTVPQNRTQ